MSLIVPLALTASALLCAAAIIAHYRATVRTARLGGFYVVAEPERTEPLKPALRVIEGGKR